MKGRERRGEPWRERGERAMEREEREPWRERRESHGEREREVRKCTGEREIHEMDAVCVPEMEMEAAVTI